MHRDLKPANVLLTADDRVKITVCTDKGPKYAHEKQNYAPVRSSSAGSVTAI